MAELSVEQQIEQLNKAKDLVHQDASFYPQIIRGVLPIASKPDLRLRRWCAQFLADGFAAIDLELKEERTALAIECLNTVEILVNEDDVEVLKNIVQCCASLYPLVFKHICENEDDTEVYKKLSGIKSRILQLWDSGSEGVRLGCIKFVQRVIAVQTPGTKDPRLADSADVSLTTVPLNHPLIPHSALEAEAQGLLDRLLSVLYESKISESTISATLYASGVLIKSRTTIANKILTRIFAFNPLTADYVTENAMRLRMEVRFIEKTLRILLNNLLKTSSIASSYGGKIQQYLQRLVQVKSLTPEEVAKRRAQLDGPQAKRQRVDSPAIDATDMSYASLYTLIDRTSPIAGASVSSIPQDLAVEIAVAGIKLVPQPVLDSAVKAVRSRYLKLFPPPQVFKIDESQIVAKAEKPFDSDDEDEYEPEYEPDYEPDYEPSLPAVAASTSVKAEIKDEDDDDEDYEPYEPYEPPDVIKTGLADQTQPVVRYGRYGSEDRENSVDLEPFVMPLPRQLTKDERLEVFQKAVERVFAAGDEFETNFFSDLSKEKEDIGKLRSVGVAGDSWVLLLSRLGTRGIVEDEQMLETIRSKLFAHVMVNFRDRADIAITWLSEEWYNEQMKTEGAKEDGAYVYWTTKMLDNVIPFLDAKDRVFLRFLSDLPELTQNMISKLRILCRDPDRVGLGRLALQYLMKLRPPVREYCAEVLASIDEQQATNE
ncbi:hypothetical protein V1512DRAFT_220667 [Lipomyces arxii]|uniref:uncharacterized protein n=1 Tax=Lipomyces arxii TaxID=56418 RepID=UPI0034CD1504